MQKVTTYRAFASKNLYLLIIAAWVFTIAIVIDSYWSANSSAKTVQKKVTSYIHNAEADFAALLADTSVMDKIRNNNYNDQLLSSLTNKNYFLFFYSVDSSKEYNLVLWNTQTVLPSAGLQYLEGKAGFAQLQNGYYAWNSYQDKGLKAIALIPVKWNYIVTNEYLNNDFAIPGISKNYDIGFTKANGPSVESVTGQQLFYIEKKFNSGNEKNNPYSVWLSLIAALLVLLFVHQSATFLARQDFLKGLVFFIGLVFLLRLLSYFIPVPINFRQFEMFDPSIYGSNPVLRSLGDLLINALLFVWFVLFLRNSLPEQHTIKLPADTPVQKWLSLGAGSLLIVLAGFTATHIITSLVSDSQISFDVINFFSLNIYSVVGFVILCCIAISFYFFTQAIVYISAPLFPGKNLPLFLSVVVAGLLLLSFRVGRQSGVTEVYVLLWLLLYLYLLNNNFLNLLATHLVSSRLVFWLFFFSVFITTLIIKENSKKEMRNRQHYAEILATKADPSSETLINSMLTDFREDYLAENYEKFTSQNSNQSFKDSLVNGNFSGYTDRYDTKIFAFDATEQPLFNQDSTDYNELNTILNTQAKPTGIPNLFYYDVSFDKFSYISKKVLTEFSGKLLGYVFIIANPKKFKNELYPELFSRGQGNAIENSSLYAFAIYNKQKLISSHNDYPFATSLDKNQFPPQEFLQRKNSNYNELWYRSGPDRMIVIAKKDNIPIESITLFSYLFCSFLLLTFLFWLINILIISRFNLEKLRFFWQLSIRNQIHGTIIFISVLSFFVIGIATILFFINRYENNNREKLSRTIRIMENEVKSSIAAGWNSKDSLSPIDTPPQDIETIINKISEIHGSDVNLYDLAGNLEVSSLPLPLI